MEKRLILFLMLSAAIFFGWSYLYTKFYPPVPEVSQEQPVANGNPSVVNGVAWTPGTQLGQSYRGITVFGDKANAWVGTRTLWSQHTEPSACCTCDSGRVATDQSQN